MVSKNKWKYIFIAFVVVLAGFALADALGYFNVTACDVSDSDSSETAKPTIEGVEIGSGNNGAGMIGRDFHFEMDVTAGELIETVQVQIQQRSDEDYSREWSHEITWDEYQGVKNANVHKHFDVPEGAAEGHYDFVIIVKDQNGTTLEEVREIELIDPSNLPVDPTMNVFSVRQKVADGDFETFYGMDEGFTDPANKSFKKGDHIEGLASVSNVRDDGSMYFLLIKKSLGHKPETVDDIDFSKAIVYDALEHKNIEGRTSFSNFLKYEEWGERERPEFIIGATEDNNIPAPNPIDGDKAWENGEYYFGMVYTNTTHDLSAHYYIEFTIEGF